jgi:hypothetical protein
MTYTLNEHDAAVIKGMLKRGDVQSDIAAWFGVNGGRIAEINTGQRWSSIKPADIDLLSPPGPYNLALRSAFEVRKTLEHLRDRINATLTQLSQWED